MIRGNKETSRAVTVSTTATLLSDTGPRSLARVFYNNGSATIFIGKDDVTTANGFPVPAGASFTDEFSMDAWYGIVASGTEEMRVLEVA